MKRRYKLYGRTPMDNISGFYIASYETAEAARRAVPALWTAYPKNLLWSVRLTGPGVEQKWYREDSKR